MQWDKVTLVGIGLLGGSLGLALKQRQLARCVHGYVRRDSAVAECLEKGAVDLVGRDMGAAVRGADLVILCTPLAQMRSLTEVMLPDLKPGALVTDVGSAKESVVRELEPLVRPSGAWFLGSHPMAGSERMGLAEARADLFEGAVCVVTPTAATPPEEVERLERFWEGVGARPVRLAPDQHDQLVCRSSHLPHIVAAALAHYVLDPELPPEQAKLCGSGFRDTTRIASGSPEMWRDICLANQSQVQAVLHDFLGNLKQFEATLQRGDTGALERFFMECKKRRDAWQQAEPCSSSE